MHLVEGLLGRDGHRSKGLSKEAQCVAKRQWMSKDENVDSEFRISIEGEISRYGPFVWTKMIKGEKFVS